MASQAKPFNSFINVDYHKFCEAHYDMPKVIVDYCKDHGQKLPESKGDIARCIYESIALRFKYDLETLEKLSNTKIELLHLIGGGTQNRLLCQFASNATGIPVIAGPTESTSAGNLLMQLKGTNEIDNLEEGRIISSNSFKVVEYSPQDQERWSEAYMKYKELLKN